MFTERPATATPQQETTPKQEFSETMAHITDVFEQIQVLCEENETAKNLFESADNWSMSLESRLQFLRDLLENDQYELPRKNTLTAKTLTHLSTLLTVLKEQTAQGNHAQATPIKEAKEALDQVFRTESLQ